MLKKLKIKSKKAKVRSRGAMRIFDVGLGEILNPPETNKIDTTMIE